MFRKKIKRVLVIGHKGFIGSHLMDHTDVLGDNYTVTGMDLKDGPLNDVRSDAWRGAEYDVIVFLACDFRESTAGYTENARMISQVNQYLIDRPSTHLIFTSSAAVYPDGYRSMREDDVSRFGAKGYYGSSKLLGEMGFQSNSKNVTILRLANVYGSRGRGVTELFKSGVRTVYGTGMQVRDFIAVEHVVTTLVDAIEHPKKWRGVFNVSSGRGRTVLSRYKLYGKGSPDFQKARPGDVKFSVLDNSKWLNNLGWGKGYISE